MPDCTTEEAEYDLAVIEEAVAAAEWAVEQAEADLKYIELQDATANKWTTMMAWWYCLAGGDGGGSRYQNLAAEAKASLRELLTQHVKNVTAHRDELRARVATSKVTS